MPPDASPERVLVVGEALVDVVDDVAHPGGGPLNVAVGLQRLGVPATLHAAFGADASGVAIAEHLEESGVAITPGTVSDRPTPVARATIGADGSATYAFDIRWDPAPLAPQPGEFAAVHTGSIGAALEPGATRVERLLTAMREDAVVSFDPNVRPALQGEHAAAVARVERFVALADVVKASDEDLAWLYPDAALPEILQRWLALGPAFVVATRGAEGAEALAASGPARIEAVRGPVADTIGAGDSFMAGLLAALSDRGLLDAARRASLRSLDGAALGEVVSFAARCAAITVSRPGADPPTRDEVAATGL
jgi:fructokinase